MANLWNVNNRRILKMELMENLSNLPLIGKNEETYLFSELSEKEREEPIR